MTAVLLKSTIESTPHENIISILDNRNNITDPRNPNSTVKLRQFIYDTDPIGKAINFSDFPYIVCEFPTLEYSNVSTDGKVKTIRWTHDITIRAVKDGSANTRTGVGRSDMLSIGDDLNQTCNNETVKQQLRDLRMYNLTLTKTNTDAIDLQNQLIYEAQYTLSYEERIQVSD